MNKSDIRLEEIHNVKLTNPEIKQRHEQSVLSRITHHFVLLEANKDVAFISLDICLDYDHVIIYELFVPRSLRHQGYGGKTLSVIEEYSHTLGFKKLKLLARPLEAGYLQKDLFKWYEKHGFHNSDGDDVFEKNF